jgi:hypothetical protein
MPPVVARRGAVLDRRISTAAVMPSSRIPTGIVSSYSRRPVGTLLGRISQIHQGHPRSRNEIAQQRALARTPAGSASQLASLLKTSRELLLA